MSHCIGAVGVLAGVLLLSLPAAAEDFDHNFTTMGTVTTSTLSVGLVDITADDGALPADILMLNFNGIGVVGGSSDSTTDGSEALHFTFDPLGHDVTYYVFVANNLDGDGFVGESFIEAFVGATSLGTVPTNDTGPHDVSALFGGAAISSFTVRADVDGFRIDRLMYSTHWDDLGGGLAGSSGIPRMRGDGWLVEGTPTTITTTRLLENTTATLVLGFSKLGLPFAGGTLVPTLNVLVPGIPTGSQGVIQLGGTWPAGVPSGFEIYTQIWLLDGAGPQGYAASNGLRGTVP